MVSFSDGLKPDEALSRAIEVNATEVKASEAKGTDPVVDQIMDRIFKRRRSRAAEEDESGTSGFLPSSAVEPKPLQWVWEGYLPRGKLACLFGEPGVGKSLVAMQIAAMVTRGWNGPQVGAQDGSAEDKPLTCEPPGKVVLLSSLDTGVANTIRPTLVEAGADLDLVLIHCADHQAASSGSTESSSDANQLYQNASGIARLEQSLKNLKANLESLQRDGVPIKLIVIDAIDQYVSSLGKRNLQRMIGELVELAERTGAAVLVVGDASPSSWGGSGSTRGQWQVEDLTKAARAVLTIAQDPDHRTRRLLLPAKLSFSGRQPGWVFTIEHGLMRWRLQKVDYDAYEFFRQMKMRAKNPYPMEESGQLRRATLWLNEMLIDGPITSMWLKISAQRNDISYITLRRAYARLGCKSLKLRGDKRWYWQLPDPARVCAYDLPRPDAEEQVTSGNEFDQTSPTGEDTWDLQAGQPAQTIWTGTPHQVAQVAHGVHKPGHDQKGNSGFISRPFVVGVGTDDD